MLASAEGERVPRERPVYRRLLSRWTTVPAMLALVTSFILPTQGLGIDLCWFKSTMSLPCPGCGLTRSMTSISHLELVEALRYHPFGYVAYLLALVLAVALVLPRFRMRLVRWLTKRERGARRVYMALVASFLVFGVARLGVALLAPDLVAHL